MNIFYFSVHHILEDDEIRLLKSLGHNVFCFGINRKHGALQGYRPSITFNATEHLMFDAYNAAGGNFDASDGDDNRVLPSGFEGHFSAFVVMHEIGFIARFWHRIRKKPVFWRTIGQGFHYEEIARPLRAEGLNIIRYSETETNYPGFCGQDALIRFYKEPKQYCGWIGNESSVLLFSNRFEQRFPREAAVYKQIAAKVPCTLAGGDNENLPASIGFVSFEHQFSLFRSHRVYLYMTGLDIPYTLNFIEAWMTGIPVVVFAPFDRVGEYLEVDRLVQDGLTGYVCRDMALVIDRCLQLLADKELASEIGSAGREAAIRYFGYSSIASQWNNLLASTV